MPDVLGLSLDPKEMATIRAVAPDSPAARAGFRVGDEIKYLEHQPMISIADVQWVLQKAAQKESLTAEVQRGSKQLKIELALPKNWRRKSDISWRPTSWDLRRMATGGLVLKEAAIDLRKELGLNDSAMALRVDYVGLYGEHGAGKRAGFQKNDVIISVDGKTERMSESDLFGYLVQNRMPGSKVPVAVLRNASRVDLELPMQ